MPWKVEHEDSEKGPELSKKRSWLTFAEQEPGLGGPSMNRGVVSWRAPLG